MAVYPTLAAVDLGSNSFHLQVARVVGDQIYPLDSLREPIRLGAGLTRDKSLEEDAQQRALECLDRFGERLRGFDRHTVRAVGTNTLRVAKNSASFLQRAQAALGFPIEVVAGREEARLIYLGVSHGLPASPHKRLVVDIGGGSTEFIIGRALKPLHLDSTYMGCVSYSRRFFEDGKISKNAMKRAELAARNEIQTLVSRFSAGNWQTAYGSSGTARALAEMIEFNGFGDGTITADGLEQLRAAMIRAGDFNALDLKGLKSDRRPVIAGGLAIMSAVLSELRIDSLRVASGAMRQGILYDLLGRTQHHDMRDVTVSQFMRRYQVDARQARRVAALALELLTQFTQGDPHADDTAPQYLAWAAKLHEIGITVAYSGYHRHSAYILQNAEMPGFSNMEQAQLASLVLTHRRSLRKAFPQGTGVVDWRMVMALRLAALIYRSRVDIARPLIRANADARAVQLDIDREWLAGNPLTVTALEEEMTEWAVTGYELDVRTLREAQSIEAAEQAA
jgi:exopolyphosphatase / guanosine-5'-triphosphate,3'-diphosphate pyrophosphatase